MPARPFISYAHEDREFAQRLCSDLRRCGVEPWLDTENLLAGQEWKPALRKAIREASHVILVISKHSVSKEGFVQREVREALDRSLEMPPERRFLIPVRIDPTEPSHEALREIQWVDVYVDYERALSRILAGLGMASEHGPTATSDRLIAHLRGLTNVNIAPASQGHAAMEGPPAEVGGPLPSRRDLYCEAIRLVQTADLDDQIRATASLFDRTESLDSLFREYLHAIAGKCRAAAEANRKLAHHALFAFRRDSVGAIPEGIRRGLELRVELFSVNGISDRIHLYQVDDDAMLDMLLVGRDRAIIAFPENSKSSHLRYGISAVGQQTVLSLVNWYEATLRDKAISLSGELGIRRDADGLTSR